MLRKKHGTLAQKRGMSERRARGSRLSKRTAAEDDAVLPMEPEPEPLHVRRSTRRTSVTTVSRSHANGGMPQASVLAQSFHVDDSHPAEVSSANAQAHKQSPDVRLCDTRAIFLYCCLKLNTQTVGAVTTSDSC